MKSEKMRDTAVAAYAAMCKNQTAYLIVQHKQDRVPLMRVCIRSTDVFTTAVVLVENGGGVYSHKRRGVAYHDESMCVAEAIYDAKRSLVTRDGLKPGMSLSDKWTADLLLVLNSARYLLTECEGGCNWVMAMDLILHNGVIGRCWRVL